MNETTMYDVKCDECKAVIRTTADVRESYAGGRCEGCKRGRIDRHDEAQEEILFPTQDAE